MSIIQIDAGDGPQPKPAVKFPRYETAKMRSKRSLRDLIHQKFEGRPIHSKRRLLRAFEQWLAESQSSFTLPVTIKRRYVDKLKCEFVGITPIISVWVELDAIDVWADMDGHHWDMLIYFWALPVRKHEGYANRLFAAQPSAVVYADPEVIWRKEVFEPFRLWVNDTLAQSHWLSFHRDDSRLSAALCRDQPSNCDSLHAVLSVHLHAADGNLTV
jgi:hypothetical protein